MHHPASRKRARGSRQPAGARSLRESASSPGPAQTPHARPANSPVTVFTQTLSPRVMYSGTWISMPVSSLAGLVRLVAEAPYTFGGKSGFYTSVVDYYRCAKLEPGTPIQDCLYNGVQTFGLHTGNPDLK